MTSLFFLTQGQLVAHAEQLHTQNTSVLEHVLSQPKFGLPIYGVGLIVILIGAKIAHSTRLALPFAAMFSLAIAFFVGNSFVLLSLIAASMTAVLALIAIFEVIAKRGK